MQDLGRHPPERVEGLVDVHPTAEVDLRDDVGAVRGDGIDEVGELDARISAALAGVGVTDPDDPLVEPTEGDGRTFASTAPMCG